MKSQNKPNMNKKAKVYVWLPLVIFSLLILGVIIMFVYDMTFGFGRYDLSCLKKIARDYCEEKEIYFSHIYTLAYVTKFACMEELRGGDKTTFEYLDGELEGCKK